MVISNTFYMFRDLLAGALLRLITSGVWDSSLIKLLCVSFKQWLARFISDVISLTSGKLYQR